MIPAVRTICLVSAMATGLTDTAQAHELFAGVYAHDVMTGLTRSGIESGIDMELGWRGDRIRALRAIGAPAPHAFVSLNTAGETSFVTAGISWRVGSRFYVRPGIGIAIHDGPSRVRVGGRRIDFGSRILFEPEIGAGIRIDERLSIEASWVHLSHATLFSPQNPGIDTIGLRLNYRL